MLLGFGYLYKFSMFYLFFVFFFQKAENNILKKAIRPKFCSIAFLFLLKIGSVGPVDQQINLVSPYENVNNSHTVNAINEKSKETK